MNLNSLSSLLFQAEHQIVRPNEIGSIKLIKDSAKEIGIHDSI
jgi:hypothetical protein